MSKKQKDLYVVDGFVFSSESEAEQAKKEQEGVKYIRSKTDMNHPEQVLQIYNRMIDEHLFQTAVGISYLKDLQEYLTMTSFVEKEAIKPITVVHPAVDERIKEERQKEKKRRQKLMDKLASNTDEETKKKLSMSLTANLVLAICVVLMFVISATSSHPTILDYETKLVNRYSAWEQELSEREAAVRELENK